MKDFVCERCRYIVDNNIQEYDAVRCRFCDEIRGIMIYCEKNVNHKKFKANEADNVVIVGWVHLACIYWHQNIEFVNHHRMEV